MHSAQTDDSGGGAELLNFVVSYIKTLKEPDRKIK